MSSYDVQRRELFPIILEAISKAYNEYGLGLEEELAKAEALHIFKDTADAGYRKASDVAREIFEEIEKRLEALLKLYPCNGEFEDSKRFVDFHWKYIRHSIMCDYDAELKKKYESEGEG